jgi:hypothetical protein
MNLRMILEEDLDRLTLVSRKAVGNHMDLFAAGLIAIGAVKLVADRGPCLTPFQQQYQSRAARFIDSSGLATHSLRSFFTVHFRQSDRAAHAYENSPMLQATSYSNGPFLAIARGTPRGGESCH